MDYEITIHETQEGRWQVASYNPQDGQFYRPMSKAERRLTGCSGVFGRTVESVSGAFCYARRADAMRCARELFGPTH